ncbi:YitT family protein [Scopulibacillus cellulosilyticus]|uniref:YitT family protein n=1 Tax=Scopulibacillus cellulosilyticus TaxID=2665665 RepID=A0ABW2PRQ5_9BACL
MEFNKEMIRFVMLTLGGFVQGLGMSLFLFPHHVPSGGSAGIAVLMNHLTPLSLGFSLWLNNFTMLFMAFKWFGFAWTIRTMYAVTVTSMTVYWCSLFISIPHVHIALDLLLGGILFGIGVGILIKYDASSGGMVVPALLISTSRSFRPGQTMFWINISIFLMTALVIDLKIVIYAIVCQWLSTKIIDFTNRSSPSV